jgi:multicomponent Na+:H+ antiporter subunit B
VIDIVLLSFMVATALAFVFVRNLFAVVMLSGIFSLTGALLYVLWDAVDVAFTEAAVGAGIATVLGLATLALTRVQDEKLSKRSTLGPLLVVLVTGAVLIDSTFDMPDYGDPNAPINRHVAPVYLRDSERQTGVPNVVTAVLASYRGYDTLGETTVIFTAACGVLVLLGRSGRRRQAAPEPERRAPEAAE